MERFIKALIGKNPKQAGVSSTVLTRDLKRRIVVLNRILIISAIIGFSIVAIYVLNGGSAG